MNVVRELRNTITHLQAELEKKESGFMKQKQKYEDMIGELQNQNERLRCLLKNQSITIMHKDEETFNNDNDHNNDNQSMSHHKNPNDQQYLDLANENSLLKSQISELSMTYQKQIDQISFYFEKIKKQNKRLLPMQAHYIGQLNFLKNQYHALVKDNEAERQKYESKLMECAELMQAYEERVKKMNEQLEDERVKNQQLAQQIKIITRISY